MAVISSFVTFVGAAGLDKGGPAFSSTSRRLKEKGTQQELRAQQNQKEPDTARLWD